jgi:hypothetical protein
MLKRFMICQLYNLKTWQKMAMNQNATKVNWVSIDYSHPFFFLFLAFGHAKLHHHCGSLILITISKLLVFPHDMSINLDFL